LQQRLKKTAYNLLAERILLVSKPRRLAFSARPYQVKFPASHLSSRRTGQPPNCSRMSLASAMLLSSMYLSSMQLLYKFLVIEVQMGKKAIQQLKLIV
jgi:hypothetical protein